MLHWLRMATVYRRALRERQAEGANLPFFAGLALFGPMMVAFWALIVIGIRWLIGL